MTAVQDRVRTALAKYPDGLTASQLSRLIGVELRNLRKVLAPGCFGVYIDRWQGPKHGKWAAVYCVIKGAPEDCPAPWSDHYDEQN